MKSLTIEQVGIIFTILAGLCTGSIFLYREYKKKQKKFRKKFHRVWTNEGDVTGFGAYSHFIDLDLSVDEEDGEIVGLANTRTLHEDENRDFNNISVNGKVYYDFARIEFTKVSRGQIHIYGKGKLKLKGKNLHLKIRKRVGPFLPDKAIMWSNSNWEFAKKPEIAVD